MPQLRRSLGRLDLIAVGINQVIGSAIFLLPAAVAAQIGGWSTLAYVGTGLASLVIALCFAEAASRFTDTGGAYLYTRAAFGNFVGFEVGWMQWFVRVSSQAGVVNGLVLALGFFLPIAKIELWRQVIITAITIAIGYLHHRGIRQSALTINLLTAAKLLPLFVVVVAGLYLIDWRMPAEPAPVTWNQAISAALLLMFAFGGFEAVTIPAGEARNPTRDIPWALGGTMLGVTVLMTLAHAVAENTLPDLASSSTPLADAAARLLGSRGALLITAGSVLSMLGNNVGGALAASRILYALSETGATPQIFARIHATFRTPTYSIWFTTAVALALALSGSFAFLISVSTVARLVTYAGVCAATLRLRESGPAPYTLPLGSALPVAGIVLSAVVCVGATRAQLVAGVGALVAGAVLYAATAAASRKARRLEQSQSARL